MSKGSTHPTLDWHRSKLRGIRPAEINPDSALELTLLSALGASPEQRRHRSERFQGLLRCLVRRHVFSPDTALCTEAKWPLRGGGLLSSVWRAYAERFKWFPTAESGINSSAAGARCGVPTGIIEKKRRVYKRHPTRPAMILA